MQPKKFALVDGNALLHRAYHAYPQTLRTSKGELVNAIYGFSRIMLTLVKSLRPDYIAIAFDRAEPTFRHLDYAGYKAHRPKMENELAGQLDLLKEVVGAMHLKSYSIAGFEADDIIGTICRQLNDKKLGIDTYIVTGDMDALQLIDENTFVYSPTNGMAHPKLWLEKDVIIKYGFEPKYIVDYKALRGDPSDSIPGVKGIGAVTAKKLIARWGTLENIYKKIASVKPPSVSEKLAQEVEMASLSKKLATIRQDVPLTIRLDECRHLEFERNTDLADFFEAMEFKSLIKQVAGSKKDGGAHGQMPLTL
ncbi:MAG: 5'-3' exonuclease H3TH domain-containing protein [bacterium]